MGFGMGFCCCDTDVEVLCWGRQSGFFLGSETGVTTVRNVYMNTIGVIAHTHAEWTGNLFDYRLVIWPWANADPPWLADLLGGLWTGRILLTAEWSPFGLTRNYVNSLAPFHGMTVAANADVGPFGCLGGSAFPSAGHPLMLGQASIRGAATASVGGGAPVANATFGGPMLPMMGQVTNGTVDWVVAGDSNFITDECPLLVPLNAQFFANLLV